MSHTVVDSITVELQLLYMVMFLLCFRVGHWFVAVVWVRACVTKR